MAAKIMIWQDLLLDRWIAAPSLQEAFAQAFGVRPSSIAVVDDPRELMAIPASSRVILERSRQRRDLPLHLLVVLRDYEVGTCARL